MASPTNIAAAVVANVLLAASLTRAHPGTWQGRVIFNENGNRFPDLTGKWEPQHDAQKPFYLKLYQPLNDIAAPPNSTYAVLSYGEADSVDFHGVCRLKAEYDYETRSRTATTVLCERRSRGQNDAARGLRGDDVSGFPWWDTQGFIVTTAGLRNETDFDRHKVSISFEPEGAGTKFLITKAVHDDGPLTGRFFTRGPGKSEIKKVHVVFANHYDVGYTDYINGVDNTYMHKYFGLAERTSEEMDSDPKSKDKFFYTTHPWIVYRFLTCTCPPNDETCMKNTLSLSLNNPYEPPLNCPSDAEVAAMEKAVKDRHIVYNSAPFNLQTEAMSPELLESGMKMSAWLDASLKVQGTTETMTIRDVMYVSRETLNFGRAGQRVKYLTIGSNNAGMPAQVPKLHTWNGTIVAYHPYGYGGYGLKDCAESPNGVALCTDFRVDNTGPPSNSSEVELVLDAVRKNYPHAEVIGSTFDNFFADVEPVKDDLPKVDLEVGDTWVYGDASDPLKMRQHRAIQRAWVDNCFSSAGEKLPCADYENSPVVRNFTFFMMKSPEHTWGTPGLSGWGASGDEYRRDTFYRNYTSTDSVIFPNKSYMRGSAAWAEQRLFNELAVRALEQGAEAHPEKYGRAARAMREAVRSVSELVEPHTSVGLTGAGYVQLPSDQLVVELSRAGDDDAAGQPASQSATIRLDRSTGALASIRFAREDGSVSRDFGEEMFGALSYQLLNDTELNPFTYAYCADRKPSGAFWKNGSNSHTESAIFTASVASVWQRPSDRGDVVVEMLFPDRSHNLYGAPSRAWLTASLAAPKAKAKAKAERVGVVGSGGSWSLDLRFVLEEKMPTMVGESTSVNFPKRQGGFGNWRLPKLAGYIDPEGVLDGGNQFNHAVWGTIVAGAEGGASIGINPLDTPVVNPIVKSKFGGIGNPLPATTDEADARAGRGLSRLPKGSVEGVSCNVHNNLWNTNYPLFYPYYDPLFCPGRDVLACSDRHILARFELAFAEGGEEAIVV